MFDSILWWDFCAQLWNVNSDAKIKNPNISQTSSIVRMSRWQIKSGTIVIKSAVVCRKKRRKKIKCVEHRIAMGLMLSAIFEMVKIIIEKMTRAKPLILNNNRSRAVLISLKESLSLSGLYFIFFSAVIEIVAMAIKIWQWTQETPKSSQIGRESQNFIYLFNWFFAVYDRLFANYYWLNHLYLATGNKKKRYHNQSVKTIDSLRVERCIFVAYNANAKKKWKIKRPISHFAPEKRQTRWPKKKSTVS